MKREGSSPCLENEWRRELNFVAAAKRQVLDEARETCARYADGITASTVRTSFDVPGDSRYRPVREEETRKKRAKRFHFRRWFVVVELEFRSLFFFFSFLSFFFPPPTPKQFPSGTRSAIAPLEHSWEHSRGRCRAVARIPGTNTSRPAFLR